MENNEFGRLNSGCMHLLIHFVGERITPLLNIDPDRYSYFDLVDDISGYNDSSMSFDLSFSHPASQSRNPIKGDSDILDMFKLNSMCSCIHVYATLLNY